MRPATALSLLCAALLAGSATATQPAKPATSTARHKSTKAKTSPYRATHMTGSAETYYALSYGVDQLSVKLAESGQLVRFNYRVTDTARASALHDKAASPYLLDEKVHAVLQVPVMEKVGPLRQAIPAEYGKSYWMVFSNKGNLVKAGHRVSIVIGQSRMDGLVVQP